MSCDSPSRWPDGQTKAPQRADELGRDGSGVTGAIQVPDGLDPGAQLAARGQLIRPLGYAQPYDLLLA